MKKFLIITFSLLTLFSVNTFTQTAEMDNEAAKLYNEGNKQKKAGNFEGALQSYEKALEISKDYRIYYQLSAVYKKQRKYEYAEQALLGALELNPEFSSAYNSLGTTYYSWGKYEKAVENFKLFQEKAGDKKLEKRAAKYIGLAYTKLGENALKDRNYGEAEKQLLSAVSNYNYDAAYLKLADVYVETGKYEEALKAADNAINFRDKKSKIPKGAPYFYKGMAFKGLQDKEKAKENFKLASSDRQYRDRSNHEIKYLN
jgi:tetratricopeptide (TPR) repeat protein